MRKTFSCLLAVVAMCVAAHSVSAATVSYNIFINGDDSPIQALAAGNYTLRVEAIVTDNDLTGGGVHGGLLQSAFDLSTDTGAIIFEDTAGGFLGGPDAKWDSTANPAFDSHFQGVVANGGGPLVIAETGAIAPGDFTAQFGDIGANVFSVITEGAFQYDGTLGTTLSLTVVNPFGGDIVVAALGGAVIVGANPDAVNNDSILLGIPEPATMVLAGMGLLALVGTRRRD